MTEGLLLDDLLHGERRRGESDEVREIIQICPSFPARLVLKIESAGYRIRNPPSV